MNCLAEHKKGGGEVEIKEERRRWEVVSGIVRDYVEVGGVLFLSGKAKGSLDINHPIFKVGIVNMIVYFFFSHIQLRGTRLRRREF